MMHTKDDTSLFDAVAAVIEPLGSVLVAYSGGVDSTVVACVARQVLGKDNAPAVLGDSPSLPRREFKEAQAIAKALDLQMHIVEPGESDDQGYVANQGNRCFYCKSYLYDAMHELADRLDIAAIANGTNADDMGDHRPGLEAARKARVVSPLLEAGLSKQDVRDLARYLNLPNADKPAAACLSSRIAYGQPVTREALARVEAAEDALHELGLRGFRVREHDRLARIEVVPDDMPRFTDVQFRDRVISELKDAGYVYVTLDIEGFRSGSGNALLSISAGRADASPTADHRPH